MNFGLTDDVTSKQSISGFPIAVDNICTLKSCSLNKRGDYDTIEFTYVMDDGEVKRELKDNRFAPDPSSAKATDKLTLAQAQDKVITDFNTLCKHIATKFDCTDNEIAGCKGTDFKSFATSFCNLINGKIKQNPDTKLYIKCYNKNGFSNVGQYVPFLQKVSDGPCKLQFTEKERNANNTVHSNGVAQVQDFQV